MFTGIIIATGSKKIKPRGDGVELIVTVVKNSTLVFEDIKIGESIAVNGVCLTVETFNKKKRELVFFVSEETCKKTNLTLLNDSTHSICNLEKALRFSDRLSGHLVQGHVDCVGKCIRLSKNSEAYDLCIEVSKDLKKYLAAKGSITIDGISLTINSLWPRSKVIEVIIKIIPHTYANTNLSSRKKGDYFNVEVDVIAKYLEGLISKK